MSEVGGEPRLFSDRHPDAAGSLGGEWARWARESKGLQLRPWQRLVLERALEVDADGRLCWPVVAVSTPRQQGKGWLLRVLAAARAAFSQRFGEPQEIYHLANNLAAARRIHSLSWKWAEDTGLVVKRAFGNERIVWPDGSHWSISALNGVYGASASLVLLDECWDIASDLAETAVIPITAERDQSSVWMLSTANADATDLFPTYRRQAVKGSSRVMLAEWSADPEADLDDPAVWRAASPHWSQRREVLVDAQRGRPGWFEQWLNIWPVDLGGERQWPAGLSECARVPTGLPPRGCVAAVDAAPDRSSVSVSAAVESGGITLWSRRFRSLQDCLDWLGDRPARLLVGLSLFPEVPPDSPYELLRAGSTETLAGTSLFEDEVRRGRVAHEHGVLVDESRAARVSSTDRGRVLSQSRSAGAVQSLKTALWCVWSIRHQPQIAPVVY